MENKIYGYARKTSSISDLVKQIEILDELRLDDIFIEALSKNNRLPVLKHLILRICNEGDGIIIFNEKRLKKDFDRYDELMQVAKNRYILVKEYVPRD